MESLRKNHKILLYIVFIPLLPVEQARFVTAKRDRFSSSKKEWFLDELWIDVASLNLTIKLIKVVVKNVLSHIKYGN